MATIFTYKLATKHRLVLLLTGDGDANTASQSKAQLLAHLATGGITSGPLFDKLSATYANQAAARDAFLFSNPIRMTTQLYARANDVTAEKNQPICDANVSGTDFQLDVQLSDTTGQLVVLTIEYVHSIVQ